MQMETIPNKIKVPRFLGGRQFTFVEKEVPQPGNGQLLIRVRANALCGSDRGFYENGAGQLTPGHEAAGFVAAAGEGTTVKAGTPGVVFLMDFCGECRSCKAGYTNLCLHKKADMGFTHDGGYGGYMLVSENIFFPTDEGLSPADATLLLDIMGTGGHAVRRALRVREDIETLLISGAGPIGLGILAMAKIMLADSVKVFVSDLNPYRLNLVEQLGGQPIRIETDGSANGLASYGYRDVDAAIDTSGQTTARLDCINRLNKRGVLVCVGHGGELPLQISQDLIASERAVLGSEYFSFGELSINAELIRKHRAYLSQIITHRVPIQEIKAAFDLFFSGQCGKVVVEHGE